MCTTDTVYIHIIQVSTALICSDYDRRVAGSNEFSVGHFQLSMGRNGFKHAIIIFEIHEPIYFE